MKTIVLVIVDFSDLTYIPRDSSSIPLARGLGVPARTQPRRSNGKEKREQYFPRQLRCRRRLARTVSFRLGYQVLMDIGGSWWTVADGVGFEPTRPLRACRFSRPVPSTARPPIHLWKSITYAAGLNQPARDRHRIATERVVSFSFRA